MKQDILWTMQSVVRLLGLLDLLGMVRLGYDVTLDRCQDYIVVIVK